MLESTELSRKVQSLAGDLVVEEGQLEEELVFVIEGDERRFWMSRAPFSHVIDITSSDMQCTDVYCNVVLLSETYLNSYTETAQNSEIMLLRLYIIRNT